MDPALAAACTSIGGGGLTFNPFNLIFLPIYASLRVLKRPPPKYKTGSFIGGGGSLKENRKKYEYDHWREACCLFEIWEAGQNLDDAVGAVATCAIIFGLHILQSFDQLALDVSGLGSFDGGVDQSFTPCVPTLGHLMAPGDTCPPTLNSQKKKHANYSN